MPPDALVVLPTYNEAENLGLLIPELRSLGFAVLVVDDNSPDGTGKIADSLADKDPGVVSVLHRPRKEGLGRAYADGFREALAGTAGVICQMDADFSHEPAELLALVAAVEAGADVAIGSRYVAGGAVPGWPVHRLWLSRWGNTYARRMLRAEIADMTSGFRAFKRDALRRLDPSSCEASGYGFQVEMAWRMERMNLTVREVPITFRDRIRGESKMNWQIAAEAMMRVTLWGIRSRVTG